MKVIGVPLEITLVANLVLVKTPLPDDRIPMFDT